MTRGMVRSGNWDRTVGSTDDLPAVKAILQHTRHNVRWEDTAYWSFVEKQIKRHGTYHGCSDVQEFFYKLERLGESIRARGVQLVSELPQSVRHNWDHLGPFAHIDDVTVAIDRDGRFLLQDGKHRLAYARAFGITSIPVAVGVRHSKWASFRREVLDYVHSRQGLSYQPILHPDFRDIRAQHDDDRMHKILEQVQNKTGTALDLGAYFGYCASMLATQGWQCLAVESHPKHVYFMKRLARANCIPLKVFEGSMFDLPRPIEYRVVLALNIFHHFLKTEKLFQRLKHFVKDLRCEYLFLETHCPEDAIMAGAFINPNPHEFASMVSSWCGLRNITLLGPTSRGRNLFCLRPDENV
ncbi:hypothetical protein [Thermostilla marina]